MWSLAIAAVAALMGGPAVVDPQRVVEHTLGANGEGRAAVVFPEAAGRHSRRRAAIYLWVDERWCRVGTGDYVRGSTLVDRGGKNRSIRMIDRSERAVDMYWRGGRLVLMKRGKQIAALDAPARGCK